MLKKLGYYKGINLGGWLSQCDYSRQRTETFITEPDIAKIASWGADHVRVPLDYNVLQNEDGSFSEYGFSKIDEIYDICRKYDLNVVLDLHKTPGFSFDFGEKESGFFVNEKYQEIFYSIWAELASRYGKYHDHIMFELLNEVTEKAFMESWKRISTECIKRIREKAPDTFILIGGYYNNAVSAVCDIGKPYDDKVIYNFHCYEPLKFTHQGAHWTPDINPSERYSFDESNINEEYFEELFKSALDSAKENNTVLYCGEYGVIDVVSPEETLRWYKVINAVFEKYNIGRSLWSYKEMNFGFSDKRMDGIREELLKYI